MLISCNTKEEPESFEKILRNMLEVLKKEAQISYTHLADKHGTKLEKYVYKLLVEISKGTPFEDSFELVSEQFFPDIIAKKYYGLEIKISKSGGWKTIGSSVAEGTRVKDVERIYLLFGKMIKPIEFKCRLYQDCLSGVAVTHSPRYTIDMNLGEGETFFDQLGISYDVLRKQETPLETVISHLRKNLKPNETTWWLASNHSKSTKAIVKLWSSLKKNEKEYLKLKGFCLFPELLGSTNKKFSRMLLWLSTEEGIVVGNLRDQYTAGGKKEFLFENKHYILPQILHQLICALSDIPAILNDLEADLLQEYWGIKYINEISKNRLNIWSKMVAKQASEISNFPLLRYIESTYYQNNT